MKESVIYREQSATKSQYREQSFSRAPVALIEPVGGHGGMDYYDYGLAYGLGSHGVKTLYYTCDVTKKRNFENVETFFSFTRLWSRNVLSKASEYIKGHAVAFRDAKSKGARIAHLHFFTFRGIDLIVLSIGKLLGFKCIGTIHDVNSFTKQANHYIELACYKLMDGVVVHNQSSLNFLTEKRLTNNPVAVIPHGNYLPFISTSSSKKSVGPELRILFFGQIKQVKGLDILLEAIAKVGTRGRKIHLTIAGKAWKSDLDYYKNLITSLGITNVVRTDFRYIPDEEVAGFYDNADLVVLPYREIYQSGVLLLSLSYGKPVLCSDLKPFMEIIRDNETGFLFESENAEDLAGKIMEIADNPDRLSTVTKMSNRLIREDYDWANIGALTTDFYKKVIEG
ncbi:glycosyltransferase [Dyadobacter fermentans]|uniref:glycosyltransferase n=1 Tax=Dyadobacter fermentans TaxID=94254 RepID=UPI001CBAC723|nr:glycosyltransferase [Dyadobacter fermentans]MBZ1357361.1 glycosyltransferase [Dyadobacter fermentans]